MRLFATKRQIVVWLEGLIDAGLPEPQVWHAAAAIEDFVTWWQAARRRPWDPRQCTEEDWSAYAAGIQTDPARRSLHAGWAYAFWRWARADAEGRRDC